MSEIVSLCCWPRTRCPELEIDRDKQKVTIRGEDPVTGESKGEVELDFEQAKKLGELLRSL